MGYKKFINNIHDRSYKDLYSNKVVFLNLVKGMLNASWARGLNEENLILVDKQYILADYEENEADIVYKVSIDDKEVIVYTLLEFQSTVDYRMPLRLFFYINEILREYTKNLTEESKKNRKGFRVPAVVPIVLYNATRKWNAPRYFKDIVNKNELFRENVVKILEANSREGVENMVANNAFMIEEMKQKVRKETEKETRKQERENIRLKDIDRVKNLLTKKFGGLNNNYNKKIEELNSDNLNIIIDNILDIESIKDVEKYFYKN